MFHSKKITKKYLAVIILLHDVTFQEQGWKTVPNVFSSSFSSPHFSSSFQYSWFCLTFFNFFLSGALCPNPPLKVCPASQYLNEPFHHVYRMANLVIFNTLYMTVSCFYCHCSQVFNKFKVGNPENLLIKLW